MEMVYKYFFPASADYYRDMNLINFLPVDPSGNRTTVNQLIDSGTRIIFSPNTELAWSIIKEMNRSFEIITRSKDIIRNIQQRNELLRSLLHNLSISDPNQTLVQNLR